MKTWFYVLGTIVVLVVLFSSGVIAASLCVRGIGCVYSTGDGVKADSSHTTTVSVRR